MSPTSVFLIDDHALFRSGLGMVLRSGIANVQVLEAGSLEEAMRCAINTPNVLLLDIQLQGLNGLEGIALLKRKWPQTPIVMLSSDAAPRTRQQALERGATAFVSKAETADNMLAVIKKVLCKETVPPKLAETERFTMAQPHLTPRQCEVLDLLCQGLPNKVIGQRLGLTENTVRLHASAVFKFLQVTSRSEAVFVARQRGLVG
jgi:DNA-binding NarL/FixJ family response regulator